MGYTRKTQHTRAVLMDSLLTNLKAKPFAEITVNDIVTPLYLDRSTFYRYFDDKYELLAAIEDDLLAELAAVNGHATKFKALTTTMLATATAFFQDHAATLEVLLGEHGTPSFEHKLKQKIAQRFELIFVPTINQTRETDLLGDLFITMVVHAFKTWVLHPHDLSLQQTLLVLRTAIDDGLLSTIKKYEK